MSKLLVKRLADPTWILAEITKLAKSADDNVQEDTDNAEAAAHSADVQMYQARVETAQHYAKELRRILSGKTWDERFAEMAKKHSAQKRAR